MRIKRRHAFIGLLALCLSLLCLVAYLNREGITYYVNSWRASSLLKKSDEAADAGDWKEAGRLALAAWQLQEGNFEALIQLYETAREEKERYLLAVSQMVFGHPEATPAHRLNVLDLFLSIGDLATFKVLFSNLSPEEQSSPEAMVLGTRFLLARNDFPRAMTLVEELIKVRGDPRDHLLKAETLVRLSKSNLGAAHDAQRTIDKLFRQEGDSEVALEAFGLLRNIPSEQWHLERFSDADDRLELIAKSAKVDPKHYLLAHEIHIHLAPHNQDMLVSAAISDWASSSPEDLSLWLLSLKETKKVLEIFGESRAYETANLFQIIVQALIVEGDWDKAEKLLKDPHPQMPLALAFGLRAGIAGQRGQVTASQSLWLQAYRQAELAPGQKSLLELAKLASRLGNTDIRNRSLTEALKRPSASNLSASEVAFIFDDLASRDEAAELLKISQNLLKSEPENPLLINNVAWLELLSGATGSIYSQKMRELVDTAPEMPSFRSTLALALMQEGRDTEALECLAPLVSAATEKRPTSDGTDLAIIALAYARNGEIERSKELSKRIDWESMMGIERDFLRNAIAGAVGNEQASTAE